MMKSLKGHMIKSHNYLDLAQDFWHETRLILYKGVVMEMRTVLNINVLL